MATDLATTGAIDPAVLEQVVVNGDLSRLSSKDRLAWYEARCHAAGLDPRTQPFQYLTLQGKLSLYATKAATDQLIANRKLTVEIVSRDLSSETGVYTVVCKVKFPDGHSVEDIGALSISTLKGDALANAYMKATTKAKRRTVLSACGLGMLDESEIETIPNASYGEQPQAPATNSRALPHPNNSGHGTGKYASPEQVDSFVKAMTKFVEGRNQKWLDRWTDRSGELPVGIKDIFNPFQAYNHLLKWAVETERLSQSIIPEEAKMRQLGQYVAIVWHRDDESKRAVKAELQRYADEQEARQTEVIRKNNPELFASDTEGGTADDLDDIVDVDFDELPKLAANA